MWKSSGCLTYHRVYKQFPTQVVCDDFSLEIECGTITCVLGPSGCGKTTLLRLAAGLTHADSGSVACAWGAGEPIGYVFQEARLLPWRTAAENVSYVIPPERRWSSREERPLELLRLVELTSAAARYPDELSGGMARRVALARALAARSSLLLLDEAFSSLDVDLKRRVVGRARDEIRSDGQTAVCATHDLDTAMRLADRIILLSAAPVRVLEDIPVPNPGEADGVLDPQTRARAERVLLDKK